ncbi:K(+)-transporting ATPase subunit C [Agriterribacter sp.]|uniref:K(+)-transporting ATPase subunit C n=1 Tax=Agriterribacter sp. TaxID=2821509 RepID=UPI002D0870A1|nr:K(+)-transporting ATPase subunit C [Agriterribacter sp.]HTN07930.1 K(+)-transporting ATPase subunit C [Agriterribacter sp.]
MKKNVLISLKLTVVMILLCAVLYPLLIAGISKMAPGGGKGVTVTVNGKVVGYERIGQQFTDDKYFRGRPSAVDYNAAGSGGSNKGPSNPDYLQIVQERIDSFLVHNPGVKKEEIPADLVTASGSGLDPDISPAAAYIQVKRIAAIRQISPEKLKTLIDKHIDKPLGGMLGPSKVNVLKLNIALDALQ